MAHATGIHAQLTIERDDGGEQPLELALGPAESLGNLEEVVERFAEAYCLGSGATAFTVGPMRLCLFEPETLTVAFDEDEEGRPAKDNAMSRRFAFAFVSQLEPEYHLHDPWLVVRPCTREQVAVWYQLMGLDERYTVRSWCLDDKLTDRFEKTAP